MKIVIVLIIFENYNVLTTMFVCNVCVCMHSGAQRADPLFLIFAPTHTNTHFLPHFLGLRGVVCVCERECVLNVAQQKPSPFPCHTEQMCVYVCVCVCVSC